MSLYAQDELKYYIMGWPTSSESSSNISSETTWSFDDVFHVESTENVHMTNIAAMPIYGKIR